MERPHRLWSIEYASPGFAPARRIHAARHTRSPGCGSCPSRGPGPAPPCRGQAPPPPSRSAPGRSPYRCSRARRRGRPAPAPAFHPDQRAMERPRGREHQRVAALVEGTRLQQTRRELVAGVHDHRLSSARGAAHGLTCSRSTPWPTSTRSGDRLGAVLLGQPAQRDPDLVEAARVSEDDPVGHGWGP